MTWRVPPYGRKVSHRLKPICLHPADIRRYIISGPTVSLCVMALLTQIMVLYLDEINYRNSLNVWATVDENTYLGQWCSQAVRWASWFALVGAKLHGRALAKFDYCSFRFLFYKEGCQDVIKILYIGCIESLKWYKVHILYLLYIFMWTRFGLFNATLELHYLYETMN